MKKFRFLRVLFTGLIAVLLFCTSCQKKETLPENYALYGYAVGDPSDGYGTILFTNNGGTSWSRLGNANLAPNISFYDVRAVNETDVWIVGAAHQGYGLILHSTDGGVNWNRAGDALSLPNNDIRSISIPNKTSIYIAGDHRTFAYSRNYGGTWTEVIFDSTMVPMVDFRAVASSGDSNVWVVGKVTDSVAPDSVSIILHSHNGGITWTRQYASSGIPNDFNDVFCLNDSIVYAAGSNGIYTYITGTIWGYLHDSSPKKMLGICALDQNNIWGVGTGDLVYSYDYATATWVTMTVPVFGYEFTDVTISNDVNIYLCGKPSAGYGKGTILSSHNGGKTWFVGSFPTFSGLNAISFVGAKK